MKPTTRLKRLICHDEDTLMMPVVHDPLCAKIAAEQGFEAIFSAGYANSAAYLGEPDVGVMTLSEMASCVSRIVDAVDLPVFADGDTGHGDVVNVGRTVRMFEKAGAAALFIEDQVFPKRCGHMSDKGVISKDYMVAKIRAAVDARRDDDFMVMARTDAVALHGLEDALDRAVAYAEAGADLLFVDGPRTMEQITRIPIELPRPVMANMVPGGLTPLLARKELQALGYACVAYPTGCSYVIAKAVRAYFQRLLQTETTAGMEDIMVDFHEFNRIVGLPEIREAQARLDPQHRAEAVLPKSRRS